MSKMTTKQGVQTRKLLDTYFQQDNCCAEMLADQKVPEGMTFEDAFEVYVAMMMTVEGDRFIHIIEDDDISEYTIKDDGSLEEKPRHIGLY